MTAEREALRLGIEYLTVLFPTEVGSFDFHVESTDRTEQYKLTAQSLRLFGLHRDVNDAHRAGANRLQNNNQQHTTSNTPPQDQDQQRTVEQTVGFAPVVQILDAPVAQMVEQLPNLTQFFDTLRPDPEQGCRSAQDLASRFSHANTCSRNAEGRTVGGSAYDRILFFVARDCGAERRHSSSSRSWRSRRSLRFRLGQDSTAFFGADQPVSEYIAPAPAVFQSPVPLGEYISP